LIFHEVTDKNKLAPFLWLMVYTGQSATTAFVSLGF